MNISVNTLPDFSKGFPEDKPCYLEFLNMNAHQALLPNTIILVGISDLVSKLPCVTQEEIMTDFSILLSVQELQLDRCKYFKLGHENKFMVFFIFPHFQQSPVLSTVIEWIES